MSIGDATAAAELFKALSHVTRLMILETLLAGSKCVTDIEDLLLVRQANVSQHLAILRHVKLVDFARSGSLRCYYLARPRLVRDLPAILQRGDSVRKRTEEEIQADKERLATKKGVTMECSEERPESLL